MWEKGCDPNFFWWRMGEKKINERTFCSLLTLLRFLFYSMEEEKWWQNISSHTLYFELCALFFEKKGFREHRTGINPLQKSFFFFFFPKNISSCEKDRCKIANKSGTRNYSSVFLRFSNNFSPSLKCLLFCGSCFTFFGQNLQTEISFQGFNRRKKKREKFGRKKKILPTGFHSYMKWKIEPLLVFHLLLNWHLVWMSRLR